MGHREEVSQGEGDRRGTRAVREGRRIRAVADGYRSASRKLPLSRRLRSVWRIPTTNVVSGVVGRDLAVLEGSHADRPRRSSRTHASHSRPPVCPAISPSSSNGVQQGRRLQGCTSGLPEGRNARRQEVRTRPYCRASIYMTFRARCRVSPEFALPRSRRLAIVDAV